MKRIQWAYRNTLDNRSLFVPVGNGATNCPYYIIQRIGTTDFNVKFDAFQGFGCLVKTCRSLTAAKRYVKRQVRYDEKVSV